MKGRKPTPRALRILRGNPRKRPLKPAEPQGRLLDALDPPSWLEPEPAAEWRRLAPMLARLGVLTETDGDALVAYCQAFVTWKTATAKIRGLGIVVSSGDGFVISPWVKVANDALAQMRVLLVEFGMTPSSRSRVQAVPAAPASKWGTHL